MTEYVVTTPGIEPSRKRARRVAGEPEPARCLYDRSGRLVWVHHPDPQHESLALLRARLKAQGYRIVEHIPPDRLVEWAAADTPASVLGAARAILEGRS